MNLEQIKREDRAFLLFFVVLWISPIAFALWYGSWWPLLGYIVPILIMGL